MINYYEILGLEKGAGIVEIKAAFRQLAKMYHPDLNPDGKEKFATILKAYEVLSDPNKKYSYDYRLNSLSRPSQQTEQKNKATKNWRFDERELKRRQYYNDHIKKYEKRFTGPTAEPEPKSTYNEFKYILFATPLAVALFLGIMTMATEKKPVPSIYNGQPANQKIVEHSDLKMGDYPYTWHFGALKYDTLKNRRLVVKNLSGKDVALCLFTARDFIRSCYIEDSYSAEMFQLPKDSLYVRYSSGYYFDKSLKFAETLPTGGFTHAGQFFASTKPIALNSVNEVTLLDDYNNTDFVKIDPDEFFKKPYD